MCIRDSIQTVDASKIPILINEEFTNDDQQLIIKIENFKGSKITGNIVPVSYTHLDVYKRQQFGMPRVAAAQVWAGPARGTRVDGTNRPADDEGNSLQSDVAQPERKRRNSATR